MSLRPAVLENDPFEPRDYGDVLAAQYACNAAGLYGQLGRLLPKFERVDRTYLPLHPIVRLYADKANDISGIYLSDEDKAAVEAEFAEERATKSLPDGEDVLRYIRELSEARDKNLDTLHRQGTDAFNHHPEVAKAARRLYLSVEFLSYFDCDNICTEKAGEHAPKWS